MVMKAALPVTRMQDATDPDDSDVFNVVVAYDNLRAGQRAMRTLTSLVDHFRGTRLEMRPQLWRFDLLDEPQWFSAALHDAIRADMLIVSTTSTNNLPATVNGWLNQCLVRKQGTGGAIVALPGAVGEVDTPQFQFLKSAATEAGLDFFTPQPYVQPGATPSAAMRQPATFIKTRPVQPYQHGGLNE
jgi:hypothetical protein